MSEKRMADPLSCSLPELKHQIEEAIKKVEAGRTMIGKIYRDPSLKSSEIEGKVIARLEQSPWVIWAQHVSRSVDRIVFTDGTWLEFGILDCSEDADFKSVKVWMIDPKEDCD